MEEGILSLVWEIASVIGITTQLLLFHKSIGDLVALTRLGRNGAARIVAISDIRSNALTLIAMCVALLTGFFFERDAPVALHYGLASVIILLAINAVWQLFDRRRLITEIGAKS